MRVMSAFGATLAAVVCFAQVAGAQQAAGVTRGSAVRLSESAQMPAADGSGAFVLEALGGSVGALAGIAVVGLTANCGTEDLGCVIIHIGAGGVAGVVGATIGTTLVARQTGSRRSVVGAALGAVVGTGVGLGLHYLLNHDSDRNLGDFVTVPLFVISQGTFAAAGSRLIGAAQGMR